MKIASPMKLASGLGTGLAFGFLLQKGRAAKRVEIVDALRFDQWRVAKIMGTASVVGGLGTYALGRAGRVEPKIKPLALGVVTGGALFGVGLAALGYCPGTTVTAAGEGQRDAMLGIAGMMVGALAYVALLPRLKPFLERGDMGEVTVPELARDGVRAAEDAVRRQRG